MKNEKRNHEIDPKKQKKIMKSQKNLKQKIIFGSKISQKNNFAKSLFKIMISIPYPECYKTL